MKNAVVCFNIDSMHFHGNNVFILLEVIDLNTYGSLADLLYIVQLFCSAAIGLLISSFYIMVDV